MYGRKRFRNAFLTGLIPAAAGVLTCAASSVATAAKVAKESSEAKAPGAVGAELLKHMKWRCIGPSRGGRSVAVAGVPGDRLTYYMGATGGGVWKTEDAGQTWRPIADEFLKTGSVGAIAVALSDTNVIYAGMGESCVRGNFSHGDGVYKSEDAGKSWKHVGLADTRQIGRIHVHPKNADLVYVAALGHVFGPNEERGVFRSKDGGMSWERVLFVDDRTGAVDLAMDATNPRILYAAFWQVRRTPYSLESGGEGSGLYKSTDGGDTWTALTKGLPEGVKGRIGVAVSPARPQRVWVQVEAEKGGLFRSDNGGETFRRVNDDREWQQRAWYYTHIYADTQDADTVYSLNVRFGKSKDGGRTFTYIRVPHSDNHDLWIAPEDNQRMINANDGGANVSFNGGASWSEQNNQPTAQFYHVAVDNQFPYRVYGAQQDNSTVSISSRQRLGRREEFFSVGGGESGYIAPHPENPDIVYAGSYGGFLTRYDHTTRRSRIISPWPENPMGWGAEALKYRFQWTFPIVISPHDPNTLFIGANVLFKTTNEGQSWEIISPDLTTNDASKQGPSGGPITHDNTSVEYFCTIFSVAESPHEKGVIWAGSDDGLLHITRDGGKSWKNVTPLDAPKWSLISMIEASPHDAGTCYAAVNAYKTNDFAPYLFKTTDYGESWAKITEGIGREAFVRSVREDPGRRGLLYAGTETGMYVSFNDGALWQSLQLNLPATPITDLVVKKNDLVAATQGRSFWILDDLTFLHQVGDEVLKSDVHLFAPRVSYKRVDDGVKVHYFLSDKTDAELKLEILESDGDAIKTFTTKSEEETDGEDDDEMASAPGGGGASKRLSAEAGVNRFEWDTRYPDSSKVKGAVMWGGGTRGPAAPPGKYELRLTVGDKLLTQPFEIAKDPRLSSDQAAFDKQFKLLVDIRDKVTEVHDAVNQIRDIRKQMDGAVERLKSAGGEHEEASEAAKPIDKKLTEIEEALIQVKAKSSQDPLNFPIKLNNKIAALSGVVASSDFAPTDGVYDVFAALCAELEVFVRVLNAVIEEDVTAFNKLMAKQAVPAVIIRANEKREE
jgi:photosystem II stability/assembly factor-like uncharacterized protein